jgi:hypothetical protein
LCVCVFCARCDAQRIISCLKNLETQKGPLRVKKKNIVVVVLKIVCK